MPNALAQNKEVCAEPGDCCQPATDEITYNDISIGFCHKHAERRGAVDIEEKV